MVTGNIIRNVVDVLKIIKDDVLKLPTKIADSVKDSLSTTVRKPLDSVVKLGEGWCSILLCAQKTCMDLFGSCILFM